MTATLDTRHADLPHHFEDLVAMSPPRAIADDSQLANTLAIIDRLMTEPALSPDQAAYLETLVQLVQAYESRAYPIGDGFGGLPALRFLLDQQAMNAAALGRLLGVDSSRAERLLSGDASLTADHLRVLGDRFCVDPGLFVA